VFDFGILPGHVVADVDHADATERLMSVGGREHLHADERAEHLVQRQHGRAERGVGHRTAEHQTRVHGRLYQIRVQDHPIGERVPVHEQRVPVPPYPHPGRRQYLPDGRARGWSRAQALHQRHAQRSIWFAVGVGHIARLMVVPSGGDAVNTTAAVAIVVLQRPQARRY